MCASKKSKFERVKKGISIVGVQQIYRVLEVVEETLEGHEVRLLNRKTLPALDLLKVPIYFCLLYHFPHETKIHFKKCY